MTSNPKPSNPSTPLTGSYYAVLELHPSASIVEVRRSYRELSKRYHPDTTELNLSVAKEKFQQLNEAYATLSNPERRRLYDQKMGYSRVFVAQPPAHLQQSASGKQAYHSCSAYLDPTDRPLSPGEIFALFILALTFIGCLVLAVAVAIARPETVLKSVEVSVIFPTLTHLSSSLL